MKALISPNETPVRYISSWVLNAKTQKYNPVYSDYENSCRIAQVVEDSQTFPIAEPMFWTDCADNILADDFYYQTTTTQMLPVVNEPYPT